MQVIFIVGIVATPIIFICLKFFAWFIKYQYQLSRLPPIPRQKGLFPILQWFGDGYEDFFRDAFEAFKDPKNPTNFLHQGPHIGGDLMISVSDPEIYKEILCHPAKFPKYVPSYETIRDFIGYGLVLLKGDEWKKERRRLTPLFHHGSLKLQMQTMSDVASLMVDRLRSLQSQPIEPNFREYTMRIIISAAFGNAFDVKWMYEKYEYLGTLVNDYTLFAIILGVDVIPYLPLPIVFKTKATVKEIHTKLAERIAIKRKELSLESDDSLASTTNYDPEETEDMLTLMLKSDPNISDRQIIDEGLTFFFAGSDTTNCTLRWATYFLAKYPDVQSRIFQETCDVFASDAIPGSDHLTKLKYTRAFLMECLRMRPPVPGLDRYLPEDTVLGGIKLPAGSAIYMNYHVTHMDPRFWENPEEFRPERFLSEETKHHPFAFVPFSAGERNCIGQKLALQEAIILLASIVKNFQVKDSDSLDKVKMSIDPLLVPSHLKVQFISR